MNAVRQSLSALPVHPVARHPELVLAALVTAVIGMMIVPVPPFALDVMLAVNMTFSAIILMSVLFSERALSVSSFPTLLLLTTLTRLSLNVSTTRLILSKGDAGEVVRAFGEFVLGGDVVVGMVVFLVITLVQFLVIAKGAERVAEVGARFTLDAMPGKQMSIDAAVRSGALTEEQGQDKRDELNRESQFYGAMDGAMKFVKGDAVAGLIITALNLVAGIAIGVVRFDLPASEAAERYAVLTVGDGLLAQIPALLITLAAGVLTTRVASKAKNANLGNELKNELLANPKVLGVGAVFALVLGLVPGLPFAPFAIIAAFFAILARVTKKRSLLVAQSLTALQSEVQQKLDQKIKQAKAQRASNDHLAPAVVPVSVDLSPSLSAALGFGDDDGADSELLGTLIPQMRDALYAETGVRYPGIRVRSNMHELAPGTFLVRIKDVPVLVESIDGHAYLACETPENLRRLGVDARPAENPLNGLTGGLVPRELADKLRSAGVRVWSPAGLVVLHLVRVLRRHAKDFVGLQETSELVERLEKAYPALVKEVVPKIVALPQLAEILRRLVEEGVSIRDLKTILEALASYGPHESDGVTLTELVRSALALQIGHAHAGMSGRLPVVLLDPVIEDTVRAAITQVATGSYVALEPEIRRTIVLSIARTLRPVVAQGVRPIILTSAEIRRYVRKLLEDDLPEATVLSFQELPPQLTIQPLGRALLHEELAA
ncbi:type III secretion system export apparatus subunit SctV [Myxococcota bacterium]|nr:type III secretion system export apparatus subunit SctV [Myxococcota bacterium]